MTWTANTGDVVLDEYAWPRPHSIAAPLAAQVATVDALTRNSRFFVLNEIGTGKTFSALWAFDILRKYGVRKRALIIAPLATLENAWKPSIPYIEPDMERVVQLYGVPAEKRRARLVDPSWDIALINPDGLFIIADMPEARSLPLIIVDESTMFKTWRSRRTKALRKIVERAGSVWLMTGEPTPESPEDLWAQVKLIYPDRVPPLMTTWRERTMIQVNRFRWVPRHNATDIMANVLRGISIRFTRDECMDLPPLHNVDLPIEQTPQFKAYEKRLREGVLQVDDVSVIARNAASVLSKILQASSGAVRGEDGEIVQVDCSPRLAALDSLIYESNHPVIVYAVHHGALDLLTKHLRTRNIPMARIDGSVPPTARQEIFEAVQTRQVKVLLAQPDAMSHGVTLTEAAVIVWWSLPFRRDTYNQANGRITRPGQRNSQLIVNLLACRVERRVLEMLRGKEKASNELLDIVREWTHT